MSGSLGSLRELGSYVYSSLVRFKAGPGVDPGEYRTEGDLAQSVEQTDPLTYVVKLRNNAKFHAPISRNVDSEDLVFSWKRSLEKNAIYRADIDSIVTPDASTAVIKLKSPDALFLTTEKWQLIQPRETGTKFDPTKTMVGSGAWIFDSYTTGSVIKFRRNPEWHFGPDAPYFENVEIAIVPEYSTLLNQFKGGNVDYISAQGADMPGLLKVVPKLTVHRGIDVFPWSHFTFDRFDSGPWKDPRVRKAVSMALDRDALTEAAYNVKALTKEGFDMPVAWGNIVPALTKPFWLDPQGKYRHKPTDPQMDTEVQKNFKVDVAEAKRLLAAAGFSSGLKTKFHYAIGRYGEPYRIMSELIPEFLRQIGIDAQPLPEDYTSVWIPKSYQGDYEGILHTIGGGGDPVSNSLPNLQTINACMQSPTGPCGARMRMNDAELNAWVLKIRSEPDPETRRVETLKLQNSANDRMYMVPTQVGTIGSFLCYGPNMRSVRDFQVPLYDTPGETLPYWWKSSS